MKGVTRRETRLNTIKETRGERQKFSQSVSPNTIWDKSSIIHDSSTTISLITVDLILLQIGALIGLTSRPTIFGNSGNTWKKAALIVNLTMLQTYVIY